MEVMRKTGKKVSYRKMLRFGLLGALSLLAVTAGGCGAPEEEAEEYPGPETACEGVWIENYDVSGLTMEQITDVINQAIAERSSEQIYLMANGMSVPVTAGELGLHCIDSEIAEKAMQFRKSGSMIQQYRDNSYVLVHGAYVLDIPYAVEEENVRAVVEQKTPALSEGSGGSTLVHNEDGSFTVIPGDKGMTLDAEGSVEKIVSYMNNEWTGGVGTLALPVQEGDISHEVAALELVQDCLGGFSTVYDVTEEERSHNIEVGTAKLNGILLYPGQSLSVCTTLEPFTVEEGYAQAHSYEQGSIVDSIGGGVCQISSTLYNALLQAELQVDERCPHSMIVGYIAPSLDAAIAENTKDLIFTNNTDAPIYIEGTAGGGTVAFWIYGHETRDPARSLAYESEILEEEKFTYTYEMDDTEEVGAYTVSEPRDGVVAQSWKIVYENGVEVSREILSKTKYRMTPMVYKIGIQGADSAEIQALADAIATNDHEQVSAMIGKLVFWHPGAKTNEEKEKEAKERAERGEPAEEAAPATEAAPAAEPAPAPEPASAT